MNAYIEIGLDEFEIDFDYTIISKGRPATGPTYACAGEPAEPMEYEIHGPIHLRSTAPNSPWLEVPTWLEETILTYLREDTTGRIYETISEAAEGLYDD